MQLLLILLGLLTIQAGVIKEETGCNGVKIKGQYYDKEILAENINSPFMLAVDYSTNILYFSYDIKTTKDEFKSARINLNTKEFINITIRNGFAQTVDQETHEIYIGGSEGIYKYDHNTSKAEYFGEIGTNIFMLYFKDILYFTEYPSQYVYTLVNGTTEKFRELRNMKVYHFLIDKENNIFYKNDAGFFSKPLTFRGFDEVTTYKTNVKLRALTMDLNGTVYACLSDGVYLVDKLSATLEHIVEVNDCFGLVFDVDDNLIYSDHNTIVRLKLNNETQC
ncbi:ommochrome-binding protein-like [Anticarsia gemmatalis]|uniref:ommochrome-binding protein-like n=1 Tax=Anticarsia gemmatalis TaxID=129554 RepID=UPI003F759FBF